MLNDLSRREKITVTVGVVSLCLFIIIQFIVFPWIEKRERAGRQLAVKTKALKEMKDLKTEYDNLMSRSADAQDFLSKRSKNFTLFSFLDDLAGKSGIKDNIVYMNPAGSTRKPGATYKTATVELKLKAISTSGLSNFLYLVETSGNLVYVKGLSITKQAQEDKYIDVVMQVETVEGV